MGNLQAWIAQLSKNQKKKPNATISEELLERVHRELLSEAPDYAECIESLESFSPTCTEKFYKEIYSSLPEDVQTALNREFLMCIERNSPRTITSRFMQSVKSRLATNKYVDELTPEVQWLISHQDEKYVGFELQKIRDNSQESTWQKLLLLDIQEWDISMNQVKSFYQILFDNSADATTQEMYKKFLKENYLGDTLQSSPVVNVETKLEMVPLSPGPLPADEHPHKQNVVVPTDNSQSKTLHSEAALLVNTTYALSSNIQQSSDLPLSTPQQDSNDVAERTETLPKEVQFPHSPSPIVAPCCEKAISVTPGNEHGNSLIMEAALSADVPKVSIENAVPSTSQQVPAEQALEKDGVKLAELLLAWSKKQVSGVVALKESLRVSEREYKRLDSQFSSLRENLFLVKKELADRDTKIASLQKQLAETTAHLDSSQKQAAELDATIQKLQRMNENSASQAVLGYKTELAAALKSIVEDANLPEAQKDADILSALLGDLLDILHFKGVPLEEK